MGFFKAFLGHFFCNLIPMLLLDIDIIGKTSSGIVFVKERLNGAGLGGVVVYDKFSDENSLLGLPEADADHEDYIVWRFTSQAATVGIKEVITAVFQADSDSSLHGKSWTIDTPLNKYYIWYNTSGTPMSGDPLVPGRISVEVAITSGATADAVALATSAALNLLSDMTATAQNDHVTITVSGVGDVCNAADRDAGVIITHISNGGTTVTAFGISNANLYPKTRPSVPDYNVFRPLQFNILTEFEWDLILSSLRFIDQVRSRHPNLGQRRLGMGFSGGFEKKFSIEELLDFLHQTVVEMNIHPPATMFWFQYVAIPRDGGSGSYNPYYVQTGIPYFWKDALVQGIVIKALLSRQIYEIDTNFNISDSGLSISYDRDSRLGSVLQGLIQQFEDRKKKIKWQHAPHGGSGIGTFFGFGGNPIYQNVINSINLRGSVSLRALSPFFAGGSP